MIFKNNFFYRLLRRSLLQGVLVLCALFSALAMADYFPTVTLQLNGKHAYRFAGYYAAVEQGFYRDRGLNVTLLEGVPGKNALGELHSGQAQYGVGNSSLIAERIAGHPIVALAAILQHSPEMLYANVYAGISSLNDLQGKRLMISPDDHEILAYLKHEKINTTGVSWIKHSHSSDDLVLGVTDAMSGDMTVTPFLLDQTYTPYISFSPRTAGLDFYDGVLFTTERELKDHPARVKAFREASLKGWRYALEHPSEVIKLIGDKYPTERSREQLFYEAEHLAQLIAPATTPIGHMDGGRWKAILHTLIAFELVPKAELPTSFLYVDNALDDMQAERKRWQWGLLFAAGVGSLAVAVAVFMLRLNRRLKAEMIAREEATAALRKSESQFRFLAENTGDVIWIMDLASQQFTYVSPSVASMRGISPKEAANETLAHVLTAESFIVANQTIKEAVDRWLAGDHSNTPVTVDIDLQHKCGEVIHTEVVGTLYANEQGAPISIIGVARNVTQRKAAEAAIRRLAFYDPLTQLPNRRLLLDRIPLHIARAKRDQRRLALLFIDLDKFKPINDQFGHKSGDRVLQEVAMRLKSLLRESDTAARIGGDEFVVMLPDITSSQNALQVADKIRVELQRPYVGEQGQTHHISASIGVTIYPDNSENEQDLLRQADDAMYAAKKRGRNGVALYTPTPNAHDFEGTPSTQPNDAWETLIHLRWRHSFCSGHPMIDQQHRELFKLSNALIDSALTRKENPERFSNAFERLLDHTIKHLADEEQILQSLHYKELEHHADRHRRLIEGAKELYERSLKEEIPTGELLTYIVEEMVYNHILKEDRQFFPLFTKAHPATVAAL